MSKWKLEEQSTELWQKRKVALILKKDEWLCEVVEVEI